MSAEQISLTPGEQRIREMIRGLGAVRPDPQFRQRLKEQFTSGDLVTQPPRVKAPARKRRLVWAWTLAPAMAVILLSLFFVFQAPSWSVVSVTADGSVSVNGKQVEADDTATLVRLLRPGAKVKTGSGTTLNLRLSDILLLEVDPGAEVTIPPPPGRRSRGTVSGTVHAGEIRVRTGPDFPGRELLVETADGRIQVTGTTISVLKGDGFTCVCVLDGVARIGKDDDSMDEIPSGMRKVMFSDGSPPMITKIEPVHKKNLRRFVERTKTVFGVNGEE